MRYWLYGCAAALLTLSAPALAQTKVTLSGTVRDAATGEDLPGATIQVVEALAGTVTNNYGFFSLSVPSGTYTLVVSYMGYTVQRREGVALTTNVTQSFQLKADAQTLDAVEIVGSADAPRSQVEMSIERLDIRTANKVPVVLGEKDIIKTLQFLPGVASGGEGSGGFSVRGGAADQNLVLLDEATIYNSSHLFGFFSVFNSDAVKDFTLYKGGIPAIYGGRLSSVLDVRQRDGNTRKAHLSGGIGLISSRLTGEVPLAKDSTGEGRGALLLAGRRSYADAFLRLSGDKELRDNTLYFYDFNAKANYRLNAKNRVFLSGYLGRDNLAIPRLFGTSWGSTTATLRWNHLFTERLFANFSAIYSNYDYKQQVYAVNPYAWKSNIINYTTKADASLFLANSTLDFGFQSTYYDFRPGVITPLSGSTVVGTRLDPKAALESALYVSNEQKFGPRFTVKAGLRYSTFLRLGPEPITRYTDNQPVRYNPISGTYQNGVARDVSSYKRGERIGLFQGWEPRLATSYALTSAHNLKASYHRMYQYLHLVSNTAAPSPIDIYTPSGPYVAPGIADQVALGYSGQLAANAYDISAEVYYKKLQNQVDYVDGAQLMFNNHVETELLAGPGRAYGLELMVRRNTGPLTGWVSYTLSRSERRVPGVAGGPGINNGAWYPTNYDRTHNLTATASYEWSAKWSFSAAFTLNSGRPATYASGRYVYSGLLLPVYGARNANRLPAYHHLDVSATYQRPTTKRWHSKWVFGIYNVYNRLNAANIYFKEKITEVNDVDTSTGITQAVKLSYFGIVPSVSYEFEF
jgi:CarboxypepD_reg-like domain/TonB-dependent Receptor Plug Domain